MAENGWMGENDKHRHKNNKKKREKETVKDPWEISF